MKTSKIKTIFDYTIGTKIYLGNKLFFFFYITYNINDTKSWVIVILSETSMFCEVKLIYKIRMKNKKATCEKSSYNHR